jgi:hypothetical protein
MVKLLKIKNEGEVLRNTQMYGPWIQKESTTFTRRDLAGANGFSSLGAHSSAVSRGRVRHHARACWLGAAGLGHGGSFCSHFSAGAVRLELRGVLRSVSFVSVGAKSRESSNSGDRQETCGGVHDESPSVKKKASQ